MKFLSKIILTAIVLFSLFLISPVSADTTVQSGPFAGCTVNDTHVVNCPAGYNGIINNYYAANGVPYGYQYGNCVPVSAKDDSLPVCGTYGYAGYPYANVGYVNSVGNVVAVYRDDRYCNGLVYITNEGGNLINRCGNGVRVFPVYYP